MASVMPSCQVIGNCRHHRRYYYTQQVDGWGEYHSPVQGIYSKLEIANPGFLTKSVIAKAESFIP
jgi:hypothetical protein